MMIQKETQNLRKKWEEWLEKIGQYLGVLLISQDVFEDIGKIVAKNKNIRKPALLHNWIINNYLHTVYTGIRRLGDKDKDSISLYRLIQDIYNHSYAITRKDYVSGYLAKERDWGLADSDFDNFADKGSNNLNKAKLQQDMNNLCQKIHKIKKYTDKWIAHLDINRKKIERPNFVDIKESLNYLDELFCSYSLLIKRIEPETCKPIIQFDWKEPLRHCWIESTKL